MRQSGAMNTCTWRTRVFRARFASDASPCRKRSIATYSPTCAPTSGQQNGAWTYGRMATGGRNNLCWTNHEAARNHHRHHERRNERPYQPKHSPSRLLQLGRTNIWVRDRTKASTPTDGPRVSPLGNQLETIYMTRKDDKGDQPSGGETTWTNTGATRSGKGQRKTGSFGDGMLRPLHNHGTQRLPNEDDE